MTPIAQRQRWEGCRPWAREPGAAEDGEVERNLVWGLWEELVTPTPDVGLSE